MPTLKFNKGPKIVIKHHISTKTNLTV